MVESRTVDDFLVVGIVRNCASTIGTEIDRIRRALRGIENLHWFLVESDSHDGSLDALDRLTKTVPNFRYATLGSLSQSMPLRTARIAHCRNAFLKEIRDNALYAGIRYVVICDLDDLNDQITEAAFRSCWLRDDWDVCTANQRGRYYDIWALRHPLWSPNDCWRQYEFLVRYNDDPNRSLDAALYSRMIHIPIESDWIEVDSAFGGFAVYRRHALDSGWYEGLHPDGREQVDHVSLHKAMRDRGMRIFINPRLINADSTEHTTQLRLRSRIARRMGYWKILLLNRLPWRERVGWFDPFSGAR